MTFTKLPKAITAEELLSTPLPPVKWIIPGLLPAGLALFAGPSKAGKSWLTLWLCLQIAQGNPVWNREIEPSIAGQIMRGKICGRYRNALVKQTAWWRSMPTKASARVRSPRSNAMKSAWHWPARSGASDFRCWSPPT